MSASSDPAPVVRRAWRVERQARRTAFVCVILIYVLLILPVGMAALPYSAAHSTLSIFPQPLIQSLSPQGWAFFTRQADEARLYFYSPDSADRLANVTAAPIGAAEWSFGFDRSSRGQALESGEIFSQVDASDWALCREAASLDACLEGALEAQAFPVANTQTVTSLCGDVIAVRRVPTPWAWRSQDDVVTETSFIHLDVAC